MRKGHLDPGQISYVDIVERNLNDILSPFLQKMSMKYSNFTPTEIQVANLIKAGKTSKEIAQIMKVSGDNRYPSQQYQEQAQIERKEAESESLFDIPWLGDDIYKCRICYVPINYISVLGKILL
jgi:hypothetical protein